MNKYALNSTSYKICDSFFVELSGKLEPAKPTLASEVKVWMVMVMMIDDADFLHPLWKTKEINSKPQKKWG